MSKLSATLTTVWADPKADPNYKFALFFATRESLAVKRIFRPGRIPASIETTLSERAENCITALMTAFACDASMRLNAIRLVFAELAITRDEFEIEIENYVCNRAYNDALVSKPADMNSNNSKPKNSDDKDNQLAIEARVAAYDNVRDAFYIIGIKRENKEIEILMSISRSKYDCHAEKTIALAEFNAMLNRYKLRTMQTRKFPSNRDRLCAEGQHLRSINVKRRVMRTADAIYAVSYTDKDAVIEILKNAIQSIGGDIELW